MTQRSSKRKKYNGTKSKRLNNDEALKTNLTTEAWGTGDGSAVD